MAAYALPQCSITMDIAYEPVLCDHGHLFDLPAITLWIGLHHNCPMDRSPLTVRQLVPVLFLREHTPVRPIQPALMLEPIVDPFPLLNLAFENVIINVMEDVDSDDDDIGPDYDVQLYEQTVANSVRSVIPFNSTHSYDVDFARIVIGSTYCPAFGSRSLQLFVACETVPFNVDSNATRDLRFVSEANVNYIRRFHLEGTVCQYTRFIYHSRLSLRQAILDASRIGLFIYDMFLLCGHTYVVYSFRQKFNRRSHTLELQHGDRSQPVD